MGLLLVENIRKKNNLTIEREGAKKQRRRGNKLSRRRRREKTTKAGAINYLTGEGEIRSRCNFVIISDNGIPLAVVIMNLNKGAVDS
uniref:Uncharacterized protein n=1 Tax=Salix viminalis TaxID=40686 RepID=A0A6N2MHA1_SALVM